MPNRDEITPDGFLSNPVQVEATRPATAAVTVAQHLVRSGREPFEKRAMLRALIRTAVTVRASRKADRNAPINENNNEM